MHVISALQTCANAFCDFLSQILHTELVAGEVNSSRAASDLHRSHYWQKVEKFLIQHLTSPVRL